MLFIDGLVAAEHEALTGGELDGVAALDVDALFLHSLGHHRLGQLLVGIHR